MKHSVALRLLIVMLEQCLLSHLAVQLEGDSVALGRRAVELPGEKEKPKHQDWRALMGGCLASLVIYLTTALIYMFRARPGWWTGEFGIALEWATVLQLLAAGIIAVTSSRWRRFGAGAAVVSGLGILIIAFIFVVGLLFSYGFAHTRLLFRPWQAHAKGVSDGFQ
jgi:hypothetical protein